MKKEKHQKIPEIYRSRPKNTQHDNNTNNNFFKHKKYLIKIKISKKNIPGENTPVKKCLAPNITKIPVKFRKEFRG